MEKMGSAEASALWDMSPTPMVETFHAALWYILRYFKTAVDDAELLLWRALLEIPRRVGTGMHAASAGSGVYLELLLRLAMRVSTWHRLRKLEEEFGEYIHVSMAVERLGGLCLDRQSDGSGGTMNEKFLCVIDGKKVAEQLVAGDAHARELLRMAKVSELSQLARLQGCETRREGSGEHVDEENDEEEKENVVAAGGHHDNKGHDRDSSGGSPIERNTVKMQINRSTTTITNNNITNDNNIRRRNSTDTKRPSTRLQSRKDDLITCILRTTCSHTSFAATWDSLIGPLCRVHHRLKEIVCRVGELMHVLSCPCGTSGALSALGRVFPPRPFSAALFLLAPRLISRRDACGVWAPAPPWWECRGLPGGGGGLQDSRALSLFAAPESLASYLQAFRLHHTLRESHADKVWRRWDVEFAMKSHKTVEEGLMQLRQQEQRGRKRGSCCLTSSFYFSSSGCLNKVESSFANDGMLGLGTVHNKEEIFTVESMLQKGGLLYEHLLPFLPKYAWYGCAELLVNILQYNKKYDLANYWLCELLKEPVYTVKSACGSITFPLYYRTQKRGKWWHRMAQNLIIMGDKEKALAILEGQQQLWREGVDKTHLHHPHLPLDMKGNSNTNIQELPSNIQRRVRLLSCVFPSAKSRGRGSPNEVALYNAVQEYTQLHFCRRFDRIAIERTLASLHRTVRRWTPFPASHKSFTNQLLAAREVTFHAVRDAMDSTLWTDTRGSMPLCRVEEHVLRCLCMREVEGDNNNNNNNKSRWTGLHCEGRWIAVLARLLLWDAYIYNPTRNDCRDKEKEKTVALETITKTTCMGLDSVWLSLFQDNPLDIVNTTTFCQRRRRIVEELLEFFEQCSKETLVDYVRRRCPVGEENDSKPSQKEEVAVLVEEGGGGGGGGQVSLLKSEGNYCEDDDDEAVLPGQPSQQKSEDALPFFHSHDSNNNNNFPFAADVGGLPLLSIVQAIPQGPLCALLRRMYLSPAEEGHSVCFAGFPDLVLWRKKSSLSSLESFVDVGFELVEVKSPSDTLGEKQMDAIDTLCRCGFNVSVARVVENNEVKKNTRR